MNLGFQEVLLIALIFILLFGPDKAKEILSKLGKAYRELMNSFERMKEEIYDEDEGDSKKHR